MHAGLPEKPHHATSGHNGNDVELDRFRCRRSLSKAEHELNNLFDSIHRRRRNLAFSAPKAVFILLAAQD